MESLKRYLLPFLVIVLLAGLVESFRSFLIAYIAEPIAVSGWTVVRILNSIDQHIYWIVLIAVCVLLVIRLVPRERDNIPRSTYTYSYRMPNRVESWKGLIGNAGLGDQDAEALRESLKKLLASALSEKQEPGTKELEELVVSERVRLSPRAKDFLFPSEGSGRKHPHGSWFNIFLFLPERLRKLPGNLAQKDLAALDEILAYLETEMEIRHDQ
jgi:hypothetical protein